MTVKSRLLELLEKNKGETLSGEAVAQELRCTRAAVWKAVKSLREEGYTIEAGPNKGYRLLKNNNRLSAEGIRPYLNNPDVFLKIYQEVESTNQTAKKAAIAKEAGHGSMVLAEHQTVGRGRRGRTFYSPEGAGLYLSIILEPGETLKESLLLTTAAAVAVHKAVEKLCSISLDIKWVNDLYLNNKKVCGILTEAITDFESGNIEFAIVGIGLNLYETKEGFPKALQGIAGSLYPDEAAASVLNRNQLAAEILNTLLEETRDLTLSPHYIKHNIIPGKTIQITDGAKTRRAYAEAIHPDGRLLVREEDGTQTLLSYGEVSIYLEP